MVISAILLLSIVFILQHYIHQLSHSEAVLVVMTMVMWQTSLLKQLTIIKQKFRVQYLSNQMVNP